MGAVRAPMLPTRADMLATTAGRVSEAPLSAAAAASSGMNCWHVSMGPTALVRKLSCMASAEMRLSAVSGTILPGMCSTADTLMRRSRWEWLAATVSTALCRTHASGGSARTGGWGLAAVWQASLWRLHRAPRCSPAPADPAGPPAAAQRVPPPSRPAPPRAPAAGMSQSPGTPVAPAAGAQTQALCRAMRLPHIQQPTISERLAVIY